MAAANLVKPNCFERIASRDPKMEESEINLRVVIFMLQFSNLDYREREKITSRDESATTATFFSMVRRDTGAEIFEEKIFFPPIKMMAGPGVIIERGESRSLSVIRFRWVLL